MRKSVQGDICRVSGRNYEEKVWQVVSSTIQTETGEPFNQQSREDLGGEYDLECNWNRTDIPMEIKKLSAPDWVQCTLRWDSSTRRWCISTNSSIPQAVKEVYQNFVDIHGSKLFRGEIPPFLMRPISWNEWVSIKTSNSCFRDMYFEAPNDTIAKIHTGKGVKYIQVSGRGLFHVGSDECNFDVPFFQCRQKFRVRIKVHRKNPKGNCHLSVTVSCMPVSTSVVPTSNFSLDNPETLPRNLTYTGQTM